MLITDDKTLQELKQEFSQKFPFLKIEFYEGHHEDGEASPARQQLNAQQKIGEARTIHTEGELSIDDQMQVGAFEKKFDDLYGLNVQVFRRSGNLWLQTTTTDNWTLSEQNTKGERSVRSYKEMHDDPS